METDHGLIAAAASGSIDELVAACDAYLASKDHGSLAYWAVAVAYQQAGQPDRAQAAQEGEGGTVRLARPGIPSTGR